MKLVGGVEAEDEGMLGGDQGDAVDMYLPANVLVRREGVYVTAKDGRKEEGRMRRRG